LARTVEKDQVVFGIDREHLASAACTVDAGDADIVAESLDDGAQPRKNQGMVVDEECFHEVPLCRVYGLLRTPSAGGSPAARGR